MKILFLNLYSKKIERGAESFVHALAAKLSKSHSVTFIKGDSATLPDDRFSHNLIQHTLKRLFLDKQGRQVLIFTLKNLNKIITSKFDIVIPLNGFWQLLILKVIQPFKGYKIIVTGHSGPGWDERWNLWLKPDLFVATTKPTFDWAKKISPWTKLTLIPYGVEQSTFHNVKPAILKLEKPIILCPAALVPYKQISTAIHAVSKLDKGSLLVLGKGPLKNRLNALGKKLLGKKRFQIMSVPYDQMPNYYAAARIVTLPSKPQENSPMIFLEALAAGLPVVTTDTPRARWMLEDAGIYTNPNDPQKYSQALKKALSLKSFNPKKALEKVTWDKIISQYEKQFQSS